MKQRRTRLTRRTHPFRRASLSKEPIPQPRTDPTGIILNLTTTAANQKEGSNRGGRETSTSVKRSIMETQDKGKTSNLTQKMKEVEMCEMMKAGKEIQEEERPALQ